MEIYGSLVNRIYESDYKDGKIEIGTGVTELGYSDRTPYYVVGINLYPKTSKYKGEIRSLVIAEAKVKRDDWTVGTGEVLPFEDGKGVTEWTKEIYFNRKSGNFTSDGTKNATIYRIGRADYYRDPSF